MTKHLDEQKAQLASLKRAIDGLFDGFSWMESPEGAKYWVDVVEKLKREQIRVELEIDATSQESAIEQQDLFSA